VTDVSIEALLGLYRDALKDYAPVRHAAVTDDNRLEHARWMVDRAYSRVESGDPFRAGVAVGRVQSELVRAGLFTAADLARHVRGVCPARPKGSRPVKMRMDLGCACGYKCCRVYRQHWLPADFHCAGQGDELRMAFDPTDRLPPLGLNAHFIVFRRGFDYTDRTEFLVLLPLIIEPAVNVESVGLLVGMLKEDGWRLSSKSAGWFARMESHRSGVRPGCDAPEAPSDDEADEEEEETT
jgi:hypothetical protein